MTETEEQELRETSAEIAAAAQSPWQPACIARAFATPPAGTLALTMQGWIDLEHAHSPLLTGRPLETIAELDVAFAAFGLERTKSTPEEAVLIELAMRTVLAEAFSMALPMRQPDAQVGVAEDGFGSWLPIYTALITQCGLAPQIASALRVDQAFALLAAHRRNQGWEAAGTPYALREIATTDSTSNPTAS
jgi:hypothetical protein